MRRAATLAAVATAVALLGVWLWLTWAYGASNLDGMPFVDVIAITLAFAVYLVVGLVLIVKRPQHRLGWVVAGIGLLTTVGVVAERYAGVALVQHPDTGLPGGIVALWFYSWYWYPLLAFMFVFVPLLYPTGHPPTPRWRWLYWVGIADTVMIFAVAATAPVLSLGDVDNPLVVAANPIGISAVGDIEQSPLGDALFAVVLVCALAAFASLVVRFRRSQGIERQQMKLFVYAGFLLITIPLIEESGLVAILPQTDVLFAMAVAAPPVAIGIAVLRYRLYDIDRLISRTVSYAVLTALLVGVYLGAVTLFTALTAPVAGASPVAVAAATLLAAAAFGPARRRIQHVVDRRFNRARYDAAQMVESYRGQLREEVDLAALAASLVAAVEESVQPVRAALWLRGVPPEPSP